MRYKYKYHGYLKSLPAPSDLASLEQMDQITFSADDLERWKTEGDPSDKAWVGVPVRKRRTEEGISLFAHFEDIRRIDNLDRNDPHFYAPLTVTPETDARFPLDCIRYPIVEITYRCPTSHAYPACEWAYSDGQHLLYLEPSREWQTAALLIPYCEFPRQLIRFSLRLYGSWRTTESMDIASVTFRAPTDEEQQYIHGECAFCESVPPPKHYAVLDEFLPFGVSMNAVTADQLSNLLDIPLFDYWRLALEDIARHHHNCVVVEAFQELGASDWSVLFDLAENFGLRLIPTLDWSAEDFEANGDALIDKHIKPYVNSKAILAWNIQDAPPETALCTCLSARDKIAAVDPHHPMIIHFNQPDAFPLFAPHFAASGFSYFRSGAPWNLGDTLRTHLPLAGGQQFWVTAPTFVYASDAPEWNTSPQLRLMMNMAIANGAKGWLAHSYHNMPVWVDGHYERSLTGPFLTFSDLWAELGNRVERLSVMAPLFLSAHPIQQPEDLHIEITVRKHPKSHLQFDMSPLSTLWLQGPDYYLLYIINNDTGQVASVNLTLPEKLPAGLEIFDTTTLVRIRSWEPAGHQRHIEMFPGQGQLFVIGEPHVCESWRDVIAKRILEADRRQAQVDLELARQYVDIDDIEKIICSGESAVSIEKLNHVHEAREQLFNRIYAAPEIYETRQFLIKASSIMCGCDEALSALHSSGHTDTAHELGVRVMPLAQQLTALRIKLRRGRGADIREAAFKIAQQSEDMMREIWNTR